ncbi:hypothetical protein A3Q34_02475 [Colwellia sp. PAMC 20917]|uniref:hybrid sensor histidine kinase/response regulator n=1 Tax=Colwellia sp. PAMC 20917 TaxID=1816218 RepID=UPI0008782122|nr:hybrid sensor histidine kinase/response regulator [Colwellia sp. PAMC 20917]AOW75820.1 hypothetical protein A3Q34_02475 [Colwellia sp. PAMC 20917]
MEKYSNMRVLIVEDDKADFIILKQLLIRAISGGISLFWVDNLQSAQAKIANEQFDFYFIDNRLGPELGLSLIPLIKQQYQNAPPIVILSGVDDHQMDLAAMREGADDYVIKDELTVRLLEKTVRYSLKNKKFETKLLAQQLLMEQMGQQARIGAWEVDLVNNRLIWSDMTKEIHQVPNDYQPDLSTAINFYKEGKSRNTIQALVSKCREDGKPFEQVLQLITAKDNKIWVSALGRAEFNQGQCIRILGSFQDITDKVTAQYKIAEHSQRMALAADSAGIGIWELNLVTNELTWDDWMFRLYGLAPDQFSGAYEAWEQGLHPDDVARATAEYQQAVESHRKYDTQFRVITPKGDIRHLKASAILRFDNDNNPISMIGVNYDVTDRVENEIALTEAKELAEVAVIAKNEFFASMSHEIRTPMNGVIGMLDLVKDSTLDQEQEHHIGIAQQSANSLLSLINDVLDCSKIDANKLIIENISFNLANMVGDVAEALVQNAQQKGLELILDLVGIEAPLVKGDSNRIRQIITNLAGNAIKFTKQGEVIIRVKQKHYSQRYWGITIEVADTGIGIAKDKHAELFQAFTQVDSSTTREYGGTGLGLTIVKNLCLCMQGTVSVESNGDQGSVFICELLLEKSSESLSPLPLKALQGKRVLIVENNSSCGNVIKRQLDRWQIETHLITRGPQALSLLISQENTPQFDLVIFNRDMPDLEGLIFVKTLRSYASLASLKIVLMTQMSNQHDLVDGLKLGLNGYFPKPLTTAGLHQALSVILDSSDKLDTKEVQTNLAIDAEKNLELPLSGLNWTKDVKLLLVDDIRVNQMVAVGMLNKLGFDNCVVAVNGKDALAKLNISEDSDLFNFIFMDCQMPEMDGYEATTLIRQGTAGARYQNIPIVAMTANAMLGDKQKCLDAGMNDYLVKPIDKDKVMNTLKLFLSEPTREPE